MLVVERIDQIFGVSSRNGADLGVDGCSGVWICKMVGGSLVGCTSMVRPTALLRCDGQ